jgi:DNA-binding HxlR family transcriptional regulator
MAEQFKDIEIAGESPADFGQPPGHRALRRGGDHVPASSPRWNRACADWKHLRSRLAAVRGKWDLAVLVNLERGVERPGDLIEVINEQAEEEISWKVLIETLRRLEEEGYVGHREISRLPRVTRYWLRPAGRRLISALARLDAWYTEGEPCTG